MKRAESWIRSDYLSTEIPTAIAWRIAVRTCRTQTGVFRPGNCAVNVCRSSCALVGCIPSAGAAKADVSQRAVAHLNRSQKTEVRIYAEYSPHLSPGAH